jgi:hypothetical protein
MLATQAEIRRIAVQSQPRQVVQETLSQENSSQKRAGGVAQDVDSEFKPQYHKKKKKKKSRNCPSSALHAVHLVFLAPAP